jgi:hypothetical protein
VAADCRWQSAATLRSSGIFPQSLALTGVGAHGHASLPVIKMTTGFALATAQVRKLVREKSDRIVCDRLQGQASIRSVKSPMKEI